MRRPHHAVILIVLLCVSGAFGRTFGVSRACADFEAPHPLNSPPTIETVAGDGTPAVLENPQGVAVDHRGNIFIGDTRNQVIRRVDPAGALTTIAGTFDTPGFSGDGGDATSATMRRPRRVIVNPRGDFVFSDKGNRRVRIVDAYTNVIRTVVNEAGQSGSDGSGPLGDGGPGLDAEVDPVGLAYDRSGNLYIADKVHHKVRKIQVRVGTISTVAGTGQPGSGGDGGPATEADLNEPTGIAIGPHGALFIADSANHKVRRVDLTTGAITTIAGTGLAGDSGDGGIATSGQMDAPTDVAVGADGTIYVADSRNHKIRTLKATTGAAYQIQTLVGDGTPGFQGDGGPVDGARLDTPIAVTMDSVGRLLVADMGNNRVRRVDHLSDLRMTTGEGLDFAPITSGTTRPMQIVTWPYRQQLTAWGGSGSYTWTTTSPGSLPPGLALSHDGVIAGEPHRVGSYRFFVTVDDGVSSRTRSFSIVVGEPIITTIAGTGSAGYNGDGIPAVLATLNRPNEAAFDPDGLVYIADMANNRVRRIDTDGIISTIAGTGDPGYNGDGIPATSAEMYYAAGVSLDPAGNVFIGDVRNDRVRSVDVVTLLIDTLAGTGIKGYNGDDIPAKDADLFEPVRPAVDKGFNLFIPDSGNERVRRIDAITGIITTVAGSGLSGYSGDGGLATDARLDYPSRVAFRRNGNLIFTDLHNHAVREVDVRTGIIDTIAGTGVQGYSGDGGLATSARMARPNGAWVDSADNVCISDHLNYRIRKVSASTRKIFTVVGTGVAGFDGDGGPATHARLRGPSGVFVADGKLLLADREGQRIRLVGRLD